MSHAQAGSRNAAQRRDCYGTVETCEEFVMGLGDAVRSRAFSFFEVLSSKGRIDSVLVAREILDCERKHIGANLTIWLKKQARELGCDLPYAGGLGEEPYGGIPNPRPSDDPGRTYYLDRDGIAARMVEALRRNP